MASRDQQWYMNTGATSHLSSHTGNLHTSSLNRNFHSIIVENGSSIPIPSLFSMPFEIPTGNKLCVTNIKLSLTIIHGLVVKPATIRIVLSLAVSRQWPIHQLDVKNAFLHGHLTKTVYMHQPPGFTDSAHSDYVCLLQNKTDSSLFILHKGLDTAYLLLYVDDIILTSSSTSLLQRIISLLHAEFVMTDLGPLNYFLGISATRATSGIFLSQTKYATEILEQAQMLNCNPCRTPIDTEKKLGPEGLPVTDPTLYRSLARSLQYLTFTRPDLSYAVQQLCLYMHDPREPHLNAMKHVLRYLRGTTDLELQLFRSTTSQLIAYSDVDWAGCPATRRSTSGYYVFLGVANAVAETSWIRNLLRELHTPLFTATLVYCDNFSVVYMSANPIQHQRTKHIEIGIHFVLDKVAAGHVPVLHVPSRFQYAYIFTKGLPYPLFADFRSSLSYGELFLIIGATAALIGPKDLPRIARVAGRLAGRSIGYVQMARGQFDNVMQQSQAKQVHKELQDTIAQLEAIRHEIRTISFVNPGPLTSRLVDNVAQNLTTNGTTDVENQSDVPLPTSTSKVYSTPAPTAPPSPSSDMHSQATAYARLAESAALRSEPTSNEVMSQLTDEFGLTVFPVSAQEAGLLPKHKVPGGANGSDIMLASILEAEVAKNAKDFFAQPQNLIKSE
ncbi:ribonuclease H-like domain-containing protein [Tanacetum coccineum]